MNGMFNWDPSPGQSLASPFLYVFFVVTIPLTIMVYVAWWWWFRRVRKEFEKQYENSEWMTIEQDMMRRMRTATNSWPMDKVTPRSPVGG